MKRSLIFGVLLVTGLGAGAAGAADHPIDGVRLLLKHSERGRDHLLFVSRGRDLPFPMADGVDDPVPEDSAGGMLELFSANTGAVASFALPGGKGRPGWMRRPGRRRGALLKYSNPKAPNGPSAVKHVVMRAGRNLIVVGRSMGLDPSVSHGAVGIRLTVGTMRLCARFDESTVKHDRPGKFSARHAFAGALTDCSDASLFGGGLPTTTTTTSTSTTTTTAPVAVDEAMFGNSVEFPDPSDHSPGYLTGTAVTIPVAVTVTHLSVIAKAGGPHVQLGLYTNSGGDPGALVVGTAQTPLVVGTVEMAVPATPVAAGTYWLMAMYDQSASVGIDSSDPSEVVKFSTASFGTGLPTSLFFPQTYFGQRFNYYLRAQL